MASRVGDAGNGRADKTALVAIPKEDSVLDPLSTYDDFKMLDQKKTPRCRAKNGWKNASGLNEPKTDQDTCDQLRFFFGETSWACGNPLRETANRSLEPYSHARPVGKKGRFLLRFVSCSTHD